MTVLCVLLSPCIFGWLQLRRDNSHANQKIGGSNPVCQSTFRQDAEPQVIPDVSIGVQVLDRKHFSIEKKCSCVCEHTPPCI